MTVYIKVNTQRDTALPVALKAGDILTGDGIYVIVDGDCAHLEGEGWPKDVLTQEEAYKTCDMVLCVGGDGTILHSARNAMIFEKPILGINTGRLGFLAVLESDELEYLHCIANGEYTVEKRSVLQAKMPGRAKSIGFALNDIVLFKYSHEKTICLNIFCDEILVSKFRGDGVIFATPTGSTAYSMSAGGPIVDARVDGCVVTQICAHIVQTPPLVFSASRILKAVNIGAEDELVGIICDGTEAVMMRPGEAVEITKAEYFVPLVQLSDAKQLKAIDKKLKGR